MDKNVHVQKEEEKNAGIAPEICTKFVKILPQIILLETFWGTHCPRCAPSYNQGRDCKQVQSQKKQTLTAFCVNESALYTMTQQSVRALRAAS